MQITEKAQQIVTESLVPAIVKGVRSAIDTVETYDTSAADRERVYGKQDESAMTGAKSAAAATQSPEVQNAGDVQAQKGEGATESMQQLKVVTAEALDLWLYESGKGLEYLKQSKAYQVTDSYLNYVATYEAVKAKGVTMLDELKNLNQRILVFYDDASNFVGMLVRVIQDRQEDLIKYVKETYSNVQVFVKDNWMRLDFDKDGQVTIEDLKKKVAEFYDFLKSYDYIQTTIEIKSSLYDRACQLIKSKKEAEKESEGEAQKEAMREAEGEAEKEEQKQEDVIEIEDESVENPDESTASGDLKEGGRPSDDDALVKEESKPVSAAAATDAAELTDVTVE